LKGKIPDMPWMVDKFCYIFLWKSQPKKSFWVKMVWPKWPADRSFCSPEKWFARTMHAHCTQCTILKIPKQTIRHCIFLVHANLQAWSGFMVKASWSTSWLIRYSQVIAKYQRSQLHYKLSHFDIIWPVQL
jgi:hypothetical protein